MRKYLFILICLLVCSCADKDTGWPVITSETKPWTRWWWMGSDVDSSGITYNLKAMAAAGIGGVEITPIYGVKGREEYMIDYLSPRWMNMLAYTEAEAKRLRMSVDMNMGTGWPFGGPDISIEDAATKAIFRKYKLKSGEKLEELIQVEDKRQRDVARLEKLIAYSGDSIKLDITSLITADDSLNWIAMGENMEWDLVALFTGKTFQQVKRAAPGGKGYVLDHLNGEAVKRYFRKFENAFSSSATSYPHTFFNDSYEVYGADWTYSLLDEFEKRRGYKLQDYFPEFLARDTTEISLRVISDYRETVGDMLRENFTEQWTEWAHAHGVTTRNQAHGSPANLIDIYASVDIPECESFGISDFDLPFLRKDSIRKDNDGDPTTLKYASSAAHITGKKYTSSETFTWLTEHFRTSLSQCKPEIDQMFTSGVNRVFFHGSTYSPEDAPWPGWKFYASVDMSPTNTIWRDAPAFFEYITRAQSVLQSGRPDNDFLLYLPIYDIWEGQQDNHFATFAIHGMRERLPEFYSAVGSIRNAGYDLDYISDRFLKTTTVVNGQLQTEGGTLYKALILPSVRLIPLETLRQILALAEKGATVVFAGHYPEDVPGLNKLEERRNEFQDLVKKMPAVDSLFSAGIYNYGNGKLITGVDYHEILLLSEVRNEEFITKHGGQMKRKSFDGGYYYFFTMLRNSPVNGWVSLAVDAQSAMFFDPMTGKRGKAKIRQEGGRTQVYLQLAPGQSVILKTFSGKDVKFKDWTYYDNTGKQTRLDTDWKLKFIESDPKIGETFDLPQLGAWTDIDKDELKINRGTALYKTEFRFEKTAGKEYMLSLGDVRESARVKVNGKDAGILFSVPFEARIGSLLKDGKNTLEVEVTNLPANRISDYDWRKVDWRIFEDINIVSITYKNTLFDTWETVPSGLLGPVVIQELEVKNP